MKTVIDKQQILIDFLFEKYPDSPRTRVKKLLQSGSVTVNDRAVTLHSYILKPGDRVDIIKKTVLPAKTPSPFPVLYEDQEVIVIDKPAGLSTFSTDGSRNIQNEVSAYLKIESAGRVRSFVVHRLDKEVSGVLLFAKSEPLMEELKNRWDETEKHYFALVEGTPPEQEGTITTYLVEDREMKMRSGSEKEGGKLAITHYKIIERAGNNTLLDISTETGRKNQIRVHLSELGNPIVGDRKYGASAEFKRRVRLHAYSLVFTHPVSGKQIEVRTQMPDGFLSLKMRDEKYK